MHLLPNLTQENDRFPGADLKTAESPNGIDLQTVGGVPNLQQALLLRFLTHKGAVVYLGHPEYGSQLYKLVGELNNETNRNRAKLYVLEALSHEARIAEVLSVSVTTNRRAPTTVTITVNLRAIGEDDPATVTFPLALA